MMTITWNIDEARAVIRAQMADANRLDEVIDDLLAETSAAIARAEAAEDRAEAAEQKLREIAQFTLKTNTRAEAAEAECERLRAQVAQAKADGANEERSLHWMRENTEIAALRKRVATLAALLDKAAALYADEWPSYFEDEVSAALEATA